jgi:hypothetical protein
VAAGPACLILGFVAAFSRKRGILGDACLASPIAWSLPEVVDNLKQGWSVGATVAIPIAALAMLPTITAARRDVNLARVILACVVLGALAIAVSPIISSQIHS